MVAGLPVDVPAAPLVRTLRESGVVGVLRAPDATSAVHATLAAARAGLHAIEVTFTTPNVTDALRDLTGQLPAGVLLGAGSVMNAAQAREAIDAGAAFLVSPHLGEDVLNVAHEAGVPYLPGVVTPSEIVRALRAGAEILKIFPIGSSGGVAYLKDLLGPFPNLQVMVTGGVTPDEIPAYLHAGALAVGLGSNFFPKREIAAQDWLGVERATRAALRQAGRPA